MTPMRMKMGAGCPGLADRQVELAEEEEAQTSGTGRTRRHHESSGEVEPALVMGGAHPHMGTASGMLESFSLAQAEATCPSHCLLWHLSGWHAFLSYAQVSPRPPSAFC